MTSSWRKYIAMTSFIVLAAAVTSPALVAQALFQSQASGSWSAPATWSILSGSSATGFPGVADTAIVANATTVSIGGTSADCAALNVYAGGVLLINGAGNLRVNAVAGGALVNGTVTISGTGTLRKQGTGTRSLTLGSSGKISMSSTAASPVFDSYSFNSSSTVEYLATANQDVLPGVEFGNLTLGGSGTKMVNPMPADTAFRCAGKLTVGSGVTFDVSTRILRIYFKGDVENYGTIDASVGVTVLYMSGASWMNYGTYRPSTTSGFGVQPQTVFINTAIGGSPLNQTFYDLRVQGVISALSNFTVTRHVTIDPGATFDGGAGLTHTVGGNWTNNGTFTQGTCTVALTGTASQTVSASPFCNLTINNPAGIILSGDVAVAPGGTCTLTNGSVTTGAYALIINNTDPGSLVLGSNRVIGTVARAIAPGSTGTYHFFSSNAYIIPNGTGNPSQLTGTVYPNMNPPNLSAGADTTLIAKRYYTLTGVGAGPGFFFSLRLPYDQAEVRGNEANYVLWGNSGGGWTNRGVSSAPDTMNNFCQQAGLASFGNWALAEPAGSLPITLSSFQGTVVLGSRDIRLTWATLSEINNYGFFVQRSMSATGQFVDLPGNFVQGHGTSLTANHYEWLDRDLIPGTYYYRLKQVDLDGTFTLTDPVMVEMGTMTGVEDGRPPEVFALSQNYPNPFNPSTRITFTVDRAASTTLKVYSILGNEVATLFDGPAQPGTEYAVTFHAGELANGAYFYRLTTGDRTTLKKMILLK